ncbi:MAG: TIM barrel protein [Deinococcales bacterium]
MSDLDPRPEHRFTFGLWTVGNVGRDPFGLPTRPARDPTQTVRKLAEIGAWGVNLHDNDLVPLDATSGERDRIVREFKQALDDHGLVVPMATTNLFSSEVDATLDAVDALARYRESLDFLAAYAADQDYALRFALEAKPNEPRGDLYLPVVGSMLGFIHTLDQPERFGVNPEFAHETMAGLNFVHAVAQALDAGKLFHIDLNDQRMSRFDQDLRFAAENLKGAFFLVKLLEDAGYDGPRHFDAHALRTEDEDGVWDFARGCMRSYLILKDKAARFDADPEIQQLVRGHRVADDKLDGYLAAYSPESAERVARRTFDLDALRNRPTHLERLDQLTIELLLGAR